MIDLDLNPVECSILDEANRQAKVYRRYARAFDKAQNHSTSGYFLFPVPESAEFPHVRNMARVKLAEISGFNLIEALIWLEENWGGKPMYPRDARDDAFDMGLSNRLLKQIGTPEQFAKWGEKTLAWGMTEPGAGSDPAAMRTSAKLDEATGEWVMNGEKIFISIINEADCCLTLARIQGGDAPGTIGLFMIEKGTPGFIIGPPFKKLGIRNRDLGSFALVDCRIPRGNRITGKLKDALSAFNGTRSLIAAEALGLTRAALDITRDALAEHGIKIDYTASPSRLTAAAGRFIELEAEYEGAWLTLLYTRWLHDREGPDKTRAAIAKVTAASASRSIIRQCMDLLGANSSTRDYFLEQAMRDSRICDIYEGPGDVLRLLIARDLLGYSAAELN